jgi:hypothetical protein
MELRAGWSASCLGRLLPGKSLNYPLNRRLGALQIQSACYGEEENIIPLLGIEQCLLDHLAQSIATILTAVNFKNV